MLGIRFFQQFSMFLLYLYPGDVCLSFVIYLSPSPLRFNPPFSAGIQSWILYVVLSVSIVLLLVVVFLLFKCSKRYRDNHSSHLRYLLILRHILTYYMCYSLLKIAICCIERRWFWSSEGVFKNGEQKIWSVKWEIIKNRELQIYRNFILWSLFRELQSKILISSQIPPPISLSKYNGC